MKSLEFTKTFLDCVRFVTRCNIDAVKLVKKNDYILVELNLKQLQNTIITMNLQCEICGSLRL